MISYNRAVKPALTRLALQYVGGLAIVAAIVFACHFVVRVNPTTVALAFVIAVVIVSANWGLRPAVFLALLATLAFNYYFLPPFGTLTIADPQNWVALFAFLVTSLIASRLSERARREAQESRE